MPLWDGLVTIDMRNANPIFVLAIAWAKVKADGIDAAALAKLHASGFLPGVRMTDEETETRRQLVAQKTVQAHL